MLSQEEKLKQLWLKHGIYDKTDKNPAIIEAIIDAKNNNIKFLTMQEMKEIYNQLF
jgi:hypothetical protein